MDATFSNYRKRLLLPLIALFAGLALSEGSWAAESGSNRARSAHGTAVFVTPAKPVVETKRSMQPQEQPQDRHHSETRSQPRSAQGDLVLVPQPQQNQQHAAEPTRARHFVKAKRNRKASSRATRAASENQASKNQVRVAAYREEIDSLSPIAKLLIEAHSISLRAATEADYSQIIEHSTTAIRQGAKKEERRFAHQLASWALNRRGQLRTGQGQQELGDADFQGALDNHPNNWRALHNRGVSFAQQGLFAEAFDDFNRVIQLNPKFAKAFVNRATLFVQAGDLQSALGDYQIAAEIDPDFSKAQLGIGRVQHRLGQWDEAVAFFEAAVQGDPTNAEILCSRGDLLADMGQYRNALADYARAIEVDPTFAHAYRNGSWLLATCPDARFRDPENALLGARQALEFDYGQRHVALDTLAAALANKGQYEEAIDTLHEALAIAPTNSKPAYTQRLQLYQQQQPFRTEPAEAVSQAAFEVTDQ